MPEPRDGAAGAGARLDRRPDCSPRSVRRSATTVPRIPGTASPGADPGCRRPLRTVMKRCTVRSVTVEDAERDVRRAKKVARRRANAVEQPIGVPLGRELQADIDQRSQPRVGGPQVSGFFGELVGEQPQVLAIERCVGSGAVSDGLAVRDAPESTRSTTLSTSADSAGFVRTSATPLFQREGPRFALAVVRRIEHHGNRAGRRVETKLPDELVPVHHRHEHVGDHQIGTLGLDRGKSLAAIGGFEQPVPSMAKERRRENPCWPRGRRRSGWWRCAASQ